MDRTYIYIDDSGDPGFSESSSSNFIIASVIVIGEEKSSILNDALNLYRRNLGWDENQAFKFSKTRKTIIIIDGSYGSKYIKEAKGYLRQQLKKSGIEDCSIKFSDSRKNVLIQLADLVAGSVGRSLSDKKDAKDYIEAFGAKIKRIFWI